HKQFQTPGNALWLHGIWTSLFILTGSFDMLANMFVFITWIAYGAGAIGIFMLRKKMKDMERSYSIWGHPVITLLFIAFSMFYLASAIWNDVSNYMAHRQPVINSLLGLLITALGIPFYFYFRQKYKMEKGTEPNQ
ncbi:MAG: amino acid permease, partial [Chitinophagaceae bacterium]